MDKRVSLLDLSRTMFGAAGIEPEGMFDGISLLRGVDGEVLAQRRPLLFFGGWHVGVNFACGITHRMSDGRLFLYAYNLTSTGDQLYDMHSPEAVDLIQDPAYEAVRDKMICMLGEELQRDPRWGGYWAEFRIARYNSLPKTNGDMQLFAGQPA